MSPQASHPKQIFLDAIENHTPDQWPAFLDQVCGDDADVKRRVRILLDAHVADLSLLDSPAIAPPATIVQPLTESSGTVIGPYKLLEQIGEGPAIGQSDRAA